MQLKKTKEKEESKEKGGKEKIAFFTCVCCSTYAFEFSKSLKPATANQQKPPV
jgi:hypothetical protein